VATYSSVCVVLGVFLDYSTDLLRKYSNIGLTLDLTWVLHWIEILWESFAVDHASNGEKNERLRRLNLTFWVKC